MRRLVAILTMALLLVLSSNFQHSVTLAQTNIGPITAGSQLALPTSAYPSDYKQSASEAWPASKADGSSFSGMHRTAYSALGLQGAWYQYAATVISSRSGSTIVVSPLETSYLGTYYVDPVSAANAYADVSANSTLSSPVPCSYGTRCTSYTIVLPFNGVTYSGMVRVIQQGNALAEIRTDTAQIVANQVSAATFTTNLDLASQAFVAIVNALQPANTPTSTSTVTPTQTPVPPSPTATSIPPTATSTATATSTPTQTPVPLFVTVKLGHKTVKAGAKQTVTVTTLAGVGVSVAVTFPDGSKKHRAGTAGGDGAYVWTFTQPTSQKPTSKRAVKVVVTVTDGSSAQKSLTVTYTSKSP